jgi:hypothetical protein
MIGFRGWPSFLGISLPPKGGEGPLHPDPPDRFCRAGDPRRGFGVQDRCRHGADAARRRRGICLDGTVDRHFPGLAIALTVLASAFRRPLCDALDPKLRDR